MGAQSSNPILEAGSPANTARFLLPLIVCYGWVVVTVARVARIDLFHVFMLFASTAATMAALVYVIGQGTVWLRGKGPLLSWESGRWVMLGAVSLALLLPSFGAFKQLLLPLRGFPLDPFLAAMGRVVLGGASPWEVTHALFGSLWATIALDRIYTFWSLFFMAFPMVVPFFADDEVRRSQMLIAWVLAWILIGTLGAWLFASAGPCYYNDLIGPDPGFAELNARLHMLAAQARGAGGELNNIEFQSVLLEAYRSGYYAPAGGVSAMPSMHVTMATLIALAGFTRSRPLGHVLAAYGAIIWIASIHLGWHYAVDGPVAVLMMLGVWRLSGRIAHALAGTMTTRERPANAPLTA